MKLSKEQKDKVKKIRKAFATELERELKQLISRKAKELDEKIKDLQVNDGIELPSYLDLCESEWNEEDSIGYVSNECIVVAMDVDPSGDWDGDNRWDNFENGWEMWE